MDVPKDGQLASLGSVSLHCVGRSCPITHHISRALRLRYEIPIVSPPSIQPNNGILTPGSSTTPLSSPTPTAKRFPSTEEPPIVFDAVIVAHRDPDWEAMLEAPLLRWMKAVVDEKRG